MLYKGLKKWREMEKADENQRQAKREKNGKSKNGSHTIATTSKSQQHSLQQEIVFHASKAYNSAKVKTGKAKPIRFEAKEAR